MVVLTLLAALLLRLGRLDRRQGVAAAQLPASTPWTKPPTWPPVGEQPARGVEARLVERRQRLLEGLVRRRASRDRPPGRGRGLVRAGGHVGRHRQPRGVGRRGPRPAPSRRTARRRAGLGGEAAADERGPGRVVGAGKREGAGAELGRFRAGRAPPSAARAALRLAEAQAAPRPRAGAPARRRAARRRRDHRSAGSGRPRATSWRAIVARAGSSRGGAPDAGRRRRARSRRRRRHRPRRDRPRPAPRPPAPRKPRRRRAGRARRRGPPRSRRRARRGGRAPATRRSRSAGLAVGAAILQRGGAQVGDHPVGDRQSGVERHPRRAGSAPRPRCGRWPRSVPSAPAPPRSGWPSAAASRAPISASAASAEARPAGRWCRRSAAPRPGGRRRAAGRPGPGRRSTRRSGGSASKAACTAAKLSASWKTGATPPSASQRPCWPGQGRRDGERPVGRGRAALDGAGQVDQQRAVLELRRGVEAGEQRLGLGAEAEADVEPGEVAQAGRGRARRTRRRAGGAAIGSWAANGRPFDQAPTSSRSSGRQTGRRAAGSAACARGALRLSRSKTVVASIWSCWSSAGEAVRLLESGDLDLRRARRPAPAWRRVRAAARGGARRPLGRRAPPVGRAGALRRQHDEALVGGALDLADQQPARPTSTAPVSRAARASAGLGRGRSAVGGSPRRGRRRRAPGSARRRRRC